jgi:hypothetical protein
MSFDAQKLNMLVPSLSATTLRRYESSRHLECTPRRHCRLMKGRHRQVIKLTFGQSQGIVTLPCPICVPKHKLLFKFSEGSLLPPFNDGHSV